MRIWGYLLRVNGVELVGFYPFASLRASSASSSLTRALGYQPLFLGRIRLRPFLLEGRDVLSHLRVV